MLQYEELRLAVLENEKPLQELKEALGYDTMKEEVAKLEAEAAKDWPTKRKTSPSTTSAKRVRTRSRANWKP